MTFLQKIAFLLIKGHYFEQFPIGPPHITFLGKNFFPPPEGSNKHFWKENEVPKMISNFSLNYVTDFRIFTFIQIVKPPGHMCARTPTFSSFLYLK